MSTQAETLLPGLLQIAVPQAIVELQALPDDAFAATRAAWIADAQVRGSLRESKKMKAESKNLCSPAMRHAVPFLLFALSFLLSRRARRGGEPLTGHAARMAKGVHQ